jgi:hypothetical protein
MADNRSANPALTRLYYLLYWLGWALLIAGFSGRWVYGPLGKSADFGWQPVWGLLLYFLPANLFALASAASCVSYLELTWRRGRPVLGGLLGWIGVFILLLALPLVWFLFDQTERGRVSLYPEGTLGWGAWVALLGLAMQVAALRLRIYILQNRK